MAKTELEFVGSTTIKLLTDSNKGAEGFSLAYQVDVARVRARVRAGVQVR